MSTPHTPISLVVYAGLIMGAIALMGAALGTPHWIELDLGLSTISFGLFKVCVKDRCESYADATRYELTDLDIIKGLCVSAVVCYGLTLMVIAHLVLGQKMLVQSRSHGSVCTLLCILGAILGWAGTGHFVLKTSDSIAGTSWSYGYSLYMASSSGIIAIAAGIAASMAVGHLFNTQRSPNIIFPAGVQTAPGIQVVSPGVSYGQYPATVVQYPGATGMAPMGSQPSVAFVNNPASPMDQKQFPGY